MPDIISIAAGTIDEDSMGTVLAGPTSHIFVSEKATWFTIPEDGFERYDRFSESM